MEKTTNYNLIKPSQTDFYNVDVINENADIIDREISNLAAKMPRIIYGESDPPTSGNPGDIYIKLV